MLRIVLTYGLIAGTCAIGGVLISLTLAEPSAESVATLEWLGYVVMLITLSLIFVAVKRFRDQEQGGVITFGRAFMVGLATAAAAGVAYVVIWEVYLAVSDSDFIGTYAEGVIAASRADGVSGEELDQIIADMAAMEANYASPLFRIPITFLEIFPVGLLIALLSAAVLRRSDVLPE